VFEQFYFRFGEDRVFACSSGDLRFTVYLGIMFSLGISLINPSASQTVCRSAHWKIHNPPNPDRPMILLGRLLLRLTKRIRVNKSSFHQPLMPGILAMRATDQATQKSQATQKRLG